MLTWDKLPDDLAEKLNQLMANPTPGEKARMQESIVTRSVEDLPNGARLIVADGLLFGREGKLLMWIIGEAAARRHSVRSFPPETEHEYTVLCGTNSAKGIAFVNWFGPAEVIETIRQSVRRGAGATDSSGGK
jgi:hypothetical protein